MHVLNVEPESTRSTRNARLIIFARGVSDFGAFLNMVALSTYVYWLSHSVMFVSVFLACRVTGGIIASLFGIAFFSGALPDEARWPGWTLPEPYC